MQTIPMMQQALFEQKETREKQQQLIIISRVGREPLVAGGGLELG
jgi:hypothetical protein